MTDGLIVSEEADLMEPYEGKDYCCQKNIDYALLEEDVLTADREGFRFTLHSEGDGSFHKILQIYDKCEKENGRLKNRHGITDLELTGAVDEEKWHSLESLVRFIHRFISWIPVKIGNKTMMKNLVAGGAVI